MPLDYVAVVDDPSTSGCIESSCPVNSYNEWDPLEEVIVGRVDGAMFPSWTRTIRSAIPSNGFDDWVRFESLIEKGVPYYKRLVRRATQNVEEFVAILEREGVRVRRPDAFPFGNEFATPLWRVRSGFSAANPRDIMMVIGNEIIEAPMADRGRYFETWAYRPLLRDYFRRGARWVSAPRPQLTDDQYDTDYAAPGPEEPMRYVTREHEPTFDAADFVRCGQDIFCQRSQVTNLLGIEWLRRHLGDKYRVHILKTKCRQPMHIDTTIVFLRPGKVMVNPCFLDPGELPPFFDSWDVLIAPEPNVNPDNPLGMDVMSDWVNVNVLSLDPERVIVERHQHNMIHALEQWGFNPIPCTFEDYYPFFGSFHCATLDVRRRGGLESYV